MNPDLNCDLGEGEPWRVTQALLTQVTSANVACGGHAGDDATMRAVLTEARVRGVRVGAHPGMPGGFGRGELKVTSAELDVLLQEQIRKLARWAKETAVWLTHVKLHGSLYDAVDRDPELAEVTLRRVWEEVPGGVMFAPASGCLSRLAKSCGVLVWAEGFADRGYRDDGSLVPRGEPGALLTDPVQVSDRIRDWRETGKITTAGGHRLALPVRTWCVHGDTPGAVELLTRVRQALDLPSRA